MLTLREAVESCGGAELADGKGHQCQYEVAVEVAIKMGATLKLPEEYRDRDLRFWSGNDGRLAAEVPRKDADKQPPGWYSHSKPKSWRKLFTVLADQRPDDAKSVETDKLLRCVTPPGNSGDGVFYIRADNGQWCRMPSSFKTLAYLHAHKVRDGVLMAGWSVRKKWEFINLPFGDEYPAERKWNRYSARLRHSPVEGPHPNWDLIFDHLGSRLTPALATNEWAVTNGIDGPRYLLAWFANLIRFPFARLPYLAFISRLQDNGKSTIHEAFYECLVYGPHGTDVVVRADRALKHDFNGELANAILCVIEETDLSSSPTAYNKIKDWVTGPNIAIRKMRTDQYEQPNSTHWIQCCNDPTYVPVFVGDTRVTMIEVPDLTNKIPKRDLMERLMAEGPQITYTLLNIVLPLVVGRLQLPAIETSIKTDMIHEAEPVSHFVEDTCNLQGTVAKDELFKVYVSWCAGNSQRPLSNNIFGRRLVSLFPAVKASRPRIGNERVNIYEGIEVKPNEQAEPRT